MASKIEERFVVRAPAAAVWAYLIDPRRVVTCLPGAELSEVVDDRTFHGLVKVKVGPVGVSYRGRVLLEEVDVAARRVRMTAEGREAAGAGAAKMRMESRLVEGPGGETEVTVSAEVDVAGKLVQFGRGMIEQVSHQIFAQFAECVRRTLEGETTEHAVALPARRELRALPLFFSALFAWLGSLFRRVLGSRAR
ncbi:MAG TPA: SRPBCC family protein [Anaeromyxobacteraceae bacterium]|nr:SRPBCC family protein [Anaeromyxobacteraceae bacterium]